MSGHGNSEVLNQVLATLASCTQPVTKAQLQQMLFQRYRSERSIKEIDSRLAYGCGTSRVKKIHGSDGQARFSLVAGAEYSTPVAKLLTGVQLPPPATPSKAACSVERPQAAAERRVATDTAEAAETATPEARASIPGVNGPEAVASLDLARGQFEARIDDGAFIPAPSAADDLAAFERARDQINAPLGLRDRLGAIAGDIEDAIGDACDAQLAHRLIKSLVVSNAAVRRAIEALPA